MTKIRALPVVENWDCHHCGHCCRSSVILLDESDLRKLEKQKWETHPDFEGEKIVVRESLLGGHKVLAKKPDGSCVFLTTDGMCRIHEEYGAEAKPGVCRMYPLQVVPQGDSASVTLRRSCPSAAADRGRPVSEHLPEIRKTDLLERFAPLGSIPPNIVPGVRRNWNEFQAAAGGLETLLTDSSLPLVRRLVHGLEFCDLLRRAKLPQVPSDSWPELMEILTRAAPDEAGEYFRQRQPPSRGTGILFRQLGITFVRAHPDFTPLRGWRERWRMLRVFSRFVRGKGRIPSLLSDHEREVSFEDLEEPLGPLPEQVMQPLNRYFEMHAVSRQYAIVVARRSLVESYRALAATFPMALWLLRLVSIGRAPTPEDMVQVVVALDRGQELPALTRAAMAMGDSGRLQGLVAWYAR